MTTHPELLTILPSLGLRPALNWWCENPDVEKTVWIYDLMSPQNTRRGALILRRTPNGYRVFVALDDDRLEAELARIAGPDLPEPPQDAAEHLARERDRSDYQEAAEAWLREGDPCPFDPAQRAWILRRIERAIEAARLCGGADSVADHFWPEVPAGEIEF